MAKKISPADLIAGRARSRGMSINDLCRKTGIPKATMSDHLHVPEKIRFWELMSISAAVGGFSVPELKALGITVRNDDEV